MVKSDRWIIEMGTTKGLIEPFESKQVRVVDSASGPRPVISYGVSSYGYDIRVASSYKILHPGERTGIVDPKNFDASVYEDFTGDVCLIPPHGMVIAQSLEYFRIPRDVLGICFGKSTYARCGIHVALAPLEPEWEGTLTFAITNTTSRPAKVYSGEGIAQLLFLDASDVCQVSYADRQGKYQKQSVLTPPVV